MKPFFVSCGLGSSKPLSFPLTLELRIVAAQALAASAQHWKLNCCIKATLYLGIIPVLSGGIDLHRCAAILITDSQWKLKLQSYLFHLRLIFVGKNTEVVSLVLWITVCDWRAKIRDCVYCSSIWSGLMLHEAVAKHSCSIAFQRLQFSLCLGFPSATLSVKQETTCLWNCWHRVWNQDRLNGS